MPEFNVNIYRHHIDLRNMSNDQLIKHFQEFGHREFRIYDIDSIHFNWRFYIQYHTDLRPAGICTRDSAITHFVNCGSKEFRKIHQDDILYPSFIKSRICVFYAYYERLFDRKNQTNLMFFINQTIRRSWPVNPESITFVFLINGELHCTVNIPKENHVIQYHLPDVQTDFHAWEIGINYMKQKYACDDLSKIFDYLVFINCSCFGPVLDETNEIHTQHWLLPFYTKLVRDQAVACSPCISYLDRNMPEGSGPRLVSTFIFVRWTQHIQFLLLEVPVSTVDESSTNINNFRNTHNTVLGHKHDKTDAILTGEYGLSRILLQYGYRITCLLYDNISNFDDPVLYDMNGSCAPDRYHSFFGENIPFLKTIFIKNIWRCECPSHYASLPVYYHECIAYMNKICHFTPIFDNNVLWEYNALPDVKSEGEHAREKQFSWKNKHDYYRLYGESEEIIIFPTISTSDQNKIAFVYSTNYCSSIRSYLIEMIQSLLFIGYHIVICLPSSPDFDELFLRHPAIQISSMRSDITSSDDFWKECGNNFQEFTFKLHVTDKVIFPIFGITQMISQLESLHSGNNWKYSEDLFEICNDQNNKNFFSCDSKDFFALPFKRNIENPENGHEKYLKRFVS